MFRLHLLIYSSSCHRLLSLFPVKYCPESMVPEPRNSKLRTYCLLYSSGEILKSVAQSLFMLTINEHMTENVCLYICAGLM